MRVNTVTTYKKVKQSNLLMERKGRSLESSMACSHIHRYFALGKLQALGSSVQKTTCVPRAVQQGWKLLGINRTLQCLFSANICQMPTMPHAQWLRASPLLSACSFQNPGSGLHLLEAARNSVLWGTGLHTSRGVGWVSDSLRHPRIKIEADPLKRS